MNRRTLVTGFLAFEGFEVNPSALLARSSGRPHELIEVAFDTVEGFLDRFVTASPAYDRVLMLGVRGGGTRIEVERVARNHVGASPDVRGQVLGPGPIESDGPDALHGSLFPDGLQWPASHDAGCYLCNYIYYRALRRLPPTVKVGFAHVPPINAVPLHEQQRDLSRLLELIESVGFPATSSRA